MYIFYRVILYSFKNKKRFPYICIYAKKVVLLSEILINMAHSGFK